MKHEVSRRCSCARGLGNVFEGARDGGGVSGRDDESDVAFAESFLHAGGVRNDDRNVAGERFDGRVAKAVEKGSVHQDVCILEMWKRITRSNPHTGILRKT